MTVGAVNRSFALIVVSGWRRPRQPNHGGVGRRLQLMRQQFALIAIQVNQQIVHLIRNDNRVVKNVLRSNARCSSRSSSSSTKNWRALAQWSASRRLEETLLIGTLCSSCSTTDHKTVTRSTSSKIQLLQEMTEGHHWHWLTMDDDLNLDKHGIQIQNKLKLNSNRTVN